MDNREHQKGCTISLYRYQDNYRDTFKAQYHNDCSSQTLRYCRLPEEESLALGGVVAEPSQAVLAAGAGSVQLEDMGATSLIVHHASIGVTFTIA